MSSTIGTLFKVTTFGESHGEGVGCVIDGCPAGLLFDYDYIKSYLKRRRPSAFFSTGRIEEDSFKVLSGIFNGYTLGTPISVVIFNENQNSKDYEDIKEIYRPSHADFTYDEKYHIRDYRGGGRASGRETVARVFSGAVAKMILKELGIEVISYTKSIGTVAAENIDISERLNNPLFFPDKNKLKDVNSLLENIKKEKDSIGGVVECIVKNLPTGLGEPVFDKIDAALSKECMSIGGVKGVEIGDGFLSATMKGSQYNDEFYVKDNKVKKKTNHAGGILGGITDGDDLILRAIVKPTPSIGKMQHTVSSLKEEKDIEIKGRHDVCIVPRVSVVVEAMVSMTIIDMLLLNMSSNMENIKKIYS